jgi:hypothetical protein
MSSRYAGGLGTGVEGATGATSGMSSGGVIGMTGGVGTSGSIRMGYSGVSNGSGTGQLR